MNNSPLVSVIIPCYNHEIYVEEALNSVFGQTYKNIELIVVDDGSSDNSVLIIEKIKKIHNFTFISQKNMGVCKTLNKAISLSRGKYVAVLASDDYWDLSKIEKQVNCLEQNIKSEFCFTQAIEFDNKNQKNNKIFPKKTRMKNTINKLFLRNNIPAGSMVFTRHLYEKVGFFDETLKFEDWDFIIRCFVQTEFSVVVEPLLYYRSHETNVMKTRQRKETFRQKVLILTKNFDLVSPFVWFAAISINFIYDIILKRGK